MCPHIYTGQVASFEYAKKLGILPGSVFVIKALINQFGGDLRRALSLIEGCIPIDHLKPAFHHYVHYAEFTAKLTIAEILWMMGFERYNKHLKNHVHNSNTPDINLAHTMSQTDTSNYLDMSEEDLYDLPSQLYHRCVGTQ